AINDEATIRLGSINKETRRADDIYLELLDESGDRTLITALHGTLSATPDIRQLVLKMQNGRQVFLDRSGDTVRTLNFDAFDVEIDLPIVGSFRDRGGEEDEATFGELLTYLSDPSNRADPDWPKYQSGFHWRLIHPLTFLVLPVLAVAMGVTGRRRASNLKPIIGVAIVVVYHELLEEWGQVIAAEGKLSPYLSMWGLLALFVAVSGFLYVGSVDKARTAKVMARRDQTPVRISTDGALAESLQPSVDAKGTPAE
ncbi:MAG: LptF/LptG family permease, partial [Pseudomonadota bacterium]